MSNIDYTQMLTAEQKLMLSVGEKEALMQELRSRRDKLLNVMDGIQGDSIAVGDLETALSVKDIKQALKDLPTVPEVVSATTQDEFRLAVMTAYGAITGPAPLTVKQAILGFLK